MSHYFQLKVIYIQIVYKKNRESIRDATAEFFFFLFLIFFCETKFELAILFEQPGDKSLGVGPY
jgi:hypothetical protein